MSLAIPDDVVDCDAQTKLFETMLRFTTTHRIMTVGDDSGWGKTTFLRKLRYLCQYRHEVPVALVPLEEFESYPDELALTKDITNQLERSPDVRFPSFNRLMLARSLHDVDMFTKHLHGSVDASDSLINESVVAGTIFKIDNVEQFTRIGAPTWTDEANRQAQRLCVEAFLGELFNIALERPLVIIFDTVESANEDLRDWLFLRLVNRGILSNPDSCKLLLVFAGKRLETALRSRFSNYDLLFTSIPSLGALEPHETVQLFEKQGLIGLQPEDVEYLHNRIIDRTMSLTSAIAVADAMIKARIM